MRTKVSKPRIGKRCHGAEAVLKTALCLRVTRPYCLGLRQEATASGPKAVIKNAGPAGEVRILLIIQLVVNLHYQTNVVKYLLQS